MPYGRALRAAVAQNPDAFVDFGLRCLSHRGTYFAEKLWTAERRGGALGIEKGARPTDFKLCLGMGGEIANSFMTLYELAYFYECAALAAVATAVSDLSLSSELDDAEKRSAIANALLGVTAAEWSRYLAEPRAATICSLDADIVPVRYGKHQLWGIPPELEKARCQSIATHELKDSFIDRTLAGLYWTDEDEFIAAEAVATEPDLNRAKALQYFNALLPFAEDMGINLYTYPLYFNYVPKEELLSLGPNHHFFQFLAEMHSPVERLKLRAITGRSDPWCLSFACPHCGQASKRVIQTKLRPDGRTIEIRCKEKPHVYQNELGTQFIQIGCGRKATIELAPSPGEIFEFVKSHDITLYYPVKQILAVMRSSHDTPVALPATDVGLQNGQGAVGRDHRVPRGFGDHLEMLTSCMAVQEGFLQGLICRETYEVCVSDDALTSHTMMLLAYPGRSPLIDADVRVSGSGRPVTDTSALKARQRGADLPELFLKSIDFRHLDLDTLLSFRTIKQNSWPAVQDAVLRARTSSI